MDFEMNLMSIDTEHRTIPEFEYDAIVQLPSSEFQTICRNLGTSTGGKSIMISCTENHIKFSAVGLISSGSIVFEQTGMTHGPADAVVINMIRPIELEFPLRYLSIFTKASSLSDSVSLTMSTRVPCVLEYKMNEFDYVRFYFASMIYDDE